MTNANNDRAGYQAGFSRRRFLQGVGATVTLPFMESLARSARSEDGAEPEGPPRRYATMLFANGVIPKEWWARGEGADMELSEILSPLAAHREDILVLNRLHIFDRVSGAHSPYFTNFLSGKPITSGTTPIVGESCDQFMASRIGKNTPMPSLVLGCEPVLTGLRGNVPSIYFHTYSWSSERTPIPPEIYPRQAFDSLFDRSGMEEDKSVLDAVLAQAKDVRDDLSQADQRKLDKYMETVRELEQRIERASEPREGGWRPELDEPDIDRPGAGRPQDVDEHFKLMLDIMVLAFQMDKTRIATMLFQSDATYDMRFGFLDGVSNESMHVISHHGNKEKKMSDHKKIIQYHVGRLAYVLERMKEIDEGESTLLDNTMILFGSSMIDGNRHDANEVPVIVAGRGGGSIKPGRVLTYEKLEDRRLCNLHLAMMQRMGVNVDSFGNSHYPLPGLS
jgi:hypothetical protein